MAGDMAKTWKASDVAIDVASDVAGGISTTAHLWMGPILRGPLSWA